MTNPETKCECEVDKEEKVRFPKESFINLLMDRDIQHLLLKRGYDIRTFDDEIQQIINSFSFDLYEMNNQLIKLLNNPEKNKIERIIIQVLIVSNLKQENWPELLHTVIAGGHSDDRLKILISICKPRIELENEKTLIFNNIFKYIKNNINNIDPHDALMMLTVPLISPKDICVDELKELKESVKEKISKINIIIHGKGKISNPNQANPHKEHNEYGKWYSLLRKLRILIDTQKYAEIKHLVR